MTERQPTDKELRDAIEMIDRFCRHLPEKWAIEIFVNWERRCLRLWNHDYCWNQVRMENQNEQTTLRSMINHARVECGLEPV